MNIADFEALCPDVSRRSLQRDLAALEAKGLIRYEGETNQLVYKPARNL
jgi:DNA-binding HxlR family transcriptional regulator